MGNETSSFCAPKAQLKHMSGGTVLPCVPQSARATDEWLDCSSLCCPKAQVRQMSGGRACMLQFLPRLHNSSPGGLPLTPNDHAVELIITFESSIVGS